MAKYPPEKISACLIIDILSNLFGNSLCNPCAICHRFVETK